MHKMNSKNKTFIDKLRSSGLRPTNQRVEISKFLFNRKKTFHKKSDAIIWARDTEYQIDKKQYQDFSDTSRYTLGDLIIKYRLMKKFLWS